MSMRRTSGKGARNVSVLEDREVLVDFRVPILSDDEKAQFKNPK